MSQRIFVTGAQGFVGRYVIARLLSAGRAVQILGMGRSARLNHAFTHVVSWGGKRIQAPLPEDLMPCEDENHYQYAAADLQQPEHLRQLLRDFRPHLIIHLASGLRDDPPEGLWRTNVEGTIHLITAIAESEIDAPRLVLCSSGGVYGIPAEGCLPIRESARCLPVDGYAASKLALEQTSRVLATRYNIPTIWARLFNVVGPGQDERHVCGRLACQVAAITAHLQPPVIAVGARATTRDFIDARDVACALEVLAERGVPGAIYNVASGIESSINTILRILLRLADIEDIVTLDQKTDGRADIPRHFADINRLQALGFCSRYPLRQSLKDLLQYYAQTVANTVERLAVYETRIRT